MGFLEKYNISFAIPDILIKYPIQFPGWVNTSILASPTDVGDEYQAQSDKLKVVRQSYNPKNPKNPKILKIRVPGFSETKILWDFLGFSFNSISFIINII